MVVLNMLQIFKVWKKKLTKFRTDKTDLMPMKSDYGYIFITNLGLEDPTTYVYQFSLINKTNMLLWKQGA